MANPQLEHGFIRIATEIIEALAHIRIPGEARQVLDAIIRKTYGFNKKEDEISLSQFCLMTGLNRPHVCMAIHKLRAMNMITEKGNGDTNIYSLNKDFESWKPLPKKVTLPKKVIEITEKGKKSLPKKVHTINNNTIDTFTKDINTTVPSPRVTEKGNTSPEVKLFIDHAFTTFQDAFREKLHIDGAKDGAIVKKLLRTYELEKLKSLWDVFLKSDDPFILQAGYSIGIFKVKINKLLVANKKQVSKYSAGMVNWLNNQKGEGNGQPG